MPSSAPPPQPAGPAVSQEDMITLIVGGIIALILLIIIGVLLYIIYELLRTYKFKQRLLAEMEAMENKRLLVSYRNQQLIATQVRLSTDRRNRASRSTRLMRSSKCEPCFPRRSTVIFTATEILE